MARHFTREEIEEIRRQLGTSAVRDSDFPVADTVLDDDEVAIIQNDTNKRLSVPVLEEHIRAPFREDETIRQANEVARKKAEGQFGSEDPDYSTSRIKKELDRQNAENERNTAENGPDGRVAKETERRAAEGTSSDEPGTDTRWGAEKQRQINEASRIETEGRMNQMLDSIVVNFLGDTDLYEQAVEQGFIGTQEDWLTSTLGVKGVGIETWVIDQSTADSGTTTHTITLNDSPKPGGPTVYTFTVKNGKGISSVAPIGTPSTTDSAVNSYRVSYSDQSTPFDFNVKNGKGIVRVVQQSTSVESGGDNVVRVEYSEGNSTTFVIKNGLQGNTGSSVDYPFELVNNLTTNDATKALTAAQGKILKDEKIEAVDVLAQVEAVPSDYYTKNETATYVTGRIADNLTTNDATKMLSAKQGKVLQDGKVNTADIVDALTSTSATVPLSAKQGKVLNDSISQLGQETHDEIKDINDFLGYLIEVSFTKLDLVNLVYDGTKVVSVSPNATMNGVQFAVEKGVKYTFQTSSYNTARFQTEPFAVDDVGTLVDTDQENSYTPNNNGYIFITLNTTTQLPLVVQKQISGLTKRISEDELRIGENKTDIDGLNLVVFGDLLSVDISITQSRITRPVYLGNPGELAQMKMSLLSGSDSGSWKLYGTNEDGTAIDTSTVIVDNTAFGTAAQFIIPANGYVWLYTTQTANADRTYRYEAKLLQNQLVARVGNLENRVGDIEENTAPFELVIVKQKNRISQLLDLGHAGKSVRFSVSVESGVDTGTWTVYGTINGSIDTSTVIVDNTEFGQTAQFTIPNDGKIWLFTSFNPTTTNVRTFKVSSLFSDTLVGRVANLESEVKPLLGKTIVCFGDSITEFIGPDGKSYPELIAEITGATVINVGIGGTQLRQRLTPSLTPTTTGKCYAGLDVVNLIRAACGVSFDDSHTYADVAVASADELAILSADDNRAIVTRLLQIDWNNVDIVTVFAGTNDWEQNGGDTGDIDTTTPSFTCGAINTIIQILCTTYKHIKLYWFTPIIRCSDPAIFSTETQYYVEDYCTYSGGYYQFTNDHLGAWDANDVVSVPRSTFRIPQYFSDNVEKNGKNLRQFSALIESVVINNHIPVCDLYNKLGWNLYNFSEYYTTDNTHPYKGFKWIADKMSKFILSN